MSTYENWTRNIVTGIRIQRPYNDKEIIALIEECRVNGTTLRIVGNTHSQTPVVTAEDEQKVVIAQLNNYSQQRWFEEEDADYIRDLVVNSKDDSCIVNAGWSLQQLYRDLRHEDDELFLPAQTAGPFFTLGGVVANCVHGGAVNYGLIHNAVLAMRIINAKGEIFWVDDEEELRYYRSSFGCLGVITHLKMKCVRYKETLRSHTRTRIADLSGNYQDENARIKACLLPNTDRHLWQEYYWNPYDDDLLCIRWQPTSEKLSTNQPAELMKYAQGAPKLAPVEFLKGCDWMPCLGDSWRRNKGGASQMATLALGGLEDALTIDKFTDNDMFYLEFATSACFISYFIPVDEAWSNVTEALKIVKDVLADDHEYEVDLPVELRFVRGSNKAWMSPIFDADSPRDQPDEEGPLWLGINIATVCGNSLDPSLNQRPQTSFNQSFATVWNKIERRWLELGGKPHYGKYYGITQGAKDGGWRSFDPTHTAAILPEENKAKMRAKLAEVDPTGIFDRSYMQEMLAHEDSVGKPVVGMGGVEAAPVVCMGDAQPAAAAAMEGPRPEAAAEPPVQE
jgi:FAD/FMN-containing dehydrogenase